MSPITLGVQVSEIQARLLAQRDIRHSARNLPRHERPPTPRAFVVEQDPIASVHPVRLSVVLADPERVELRDTVRTPRVERGVLVLRDLLDETVELRGGGLVETDVFLEAAGTDGVQETERAKGVDVGGVLCHLKGNFDVGLGTEVVDFRGLDLSEDIDEVCAVREITMVELQFVRSCRETIRLDEAKDA